jgi:CubicO group peptidase (beta-lactamase class C family)
MHNGKEVFGKSYGLSDFELGTPNKRSTVFRIGSITKEFTAVLTMQLVEQRKLSLDSTVTKYLPWYGEIGSKIKIKHLLSHTSGLNNYTANPEEFYKEMAYFAKSPKEFAEKYLRHQKLLFEPGTKYQYCNTDYYLLGLIIEAVAGKTYEKVLRESILQKAGMKNSGIDSISTIISNRAKGYNYSYEGYVNAEPINMATSIYAAGAMYSTVDDLQLWQAALNGNMLLTDASKKLLFTPFINNHGFGFFVNKLKTGKRAIGHPGGINGFSSFMIHFEDDDITIVLLDNTTAHRRGNLDNMCSSIYSILLDEPYETPKKPINVELTDTYLEQGIQRTLDLYNKIKNDTNYDLKDSDTFLNNFGYTLLQKGKIKESLLTLKLAAEEFPNSANTLDSYAEALKTDGQYAMAIDYYNRAQKLDPDNEKFQEEISNLQKKFR